MEIEIESKRSNPLLNRTEVHFTIKHQGEKTPNRELIRTELAEKLNAKKENVIVNIINSGFGNQETTGYAKVYLSQKQSMDLEKDHILIRNKIIQKEGKDKKKPAEGKPAPIAAPTLPQSETPAEPPAEQAKEEQPPSEEPTPKAEPPAEEHKEPISDTEEKPPEETQTPSEIVKEPNEETKEEEKPEEQKKEETSEQKKSEEKTENTEDEEKE